MNNELKEQILDTLSWCETSLKGEPSRQELDSVTRTLKNLVSDLRKATEQLTQ